MHVRGSSGFLYARMPLAWQIFSARTDNPFARMPDPIQDTIVELELWRSSASHLPIEYRCVPRAHGTVELSYFILHNTQYVYCVCSSLCESPTQISSRSKGAVNYNSTSIIRLSCLRRVRNEFGRIRCTCSEALVSNRLWSFKNMHNSNNSVSSVYSSPYV